jgi:LysM repeat protein
MGQAASLPESAFVPGLVGHAQGYSLSCESRSAVDWAAFWGVEIRESDFLANLPRSDNPDLGFVGNPNDLWGYLPPDSYGVHAKPVAKLLRNLGLQADDRNDMKWKELRAEIAAGRPVIVWVIGQMWRGYPQRYTDSQGRVATVAAYEHTMILVGYDPLQVQLVDAYTGQLVSYPVSAFQESWSVLGNMAITGNGRAEASKPAQPAGGEMENAGDAYIVQPGDYLVKVANQFNTTWSRLVELNDLQYPYTLYAGQTLRVPERSTVEEPAPDAVGTSRERSGDEIATYTVQPGDYLKSIADRFGLAWTKLAELNGLQYPYVIFTGQELQIK